MIDLYSYTHYAPSPCAVDTVERVGWLLRGCPEGSRLDQPRPRSEIRLIRLPGGEWHITSDVPLAGPQLAYVQFSGSEDMIALMIWADAVRRDGGKPYIVFPYLPGARQDRRQTGEALSAIVYAQMINACKAEQVVCFDPHSDVMPSHINNLTIVPLTGDIVAKMLVLNPKRPTFDGVITPDAGAGKRTFRVASDLKLPLFQALKHRNMDTGKLSHFTCEPTPNQVESEQPMAMRPAHYLMVDDICDGGGTFKGLAGVLAKTGITKDQLSLVTSHGVLSKGADELGKFFSAIYTTDSHGGASGYMSLVRYNVGYNHEFILPLLPVLILSISVA